jgi:type IV pilus assembly protein PilC
MAKLSMKRMVPMFRRLAMSIDTGIDARTMWQREIDYAAPSAKPGLQRLFQAVSYGDSVAVGMRQSGLFPPLVCEMVKVGEKSGHLETVFQQLAEHYENLIQMRRTFLQGIAWPAIEFFGAVVIFC